MEGGEGRLREKLGKEFAKYVEYYKALQLEKVEKKKCTKEGHILLPNLAAPAGL